MTGQRATDARIASRMRDAVINNDDDVYRALAFQNRHLVVAALEASSRQEERLREALSRVDKFIENYRAPWGSWKTVWWEGEVSDDAAFSDDNAMMHIANIVRPALEPPHAKDAADV